VLFRSRNCFRVYFKQRILNALKMKISKGSKRQTCSQRYNIQKKIRSHNKKEKKVANKGKSAGGVQKSKNKNKKIVIPNSFPFKAELLKQAEIAKQEKLKEKAEKKVAKKKERQEASTKTLEQLKEESELKQEAFDKTLLDNTKNSEGELKGEHLNVHDFYSELNKVIKQSDVIIEVLDARDPLGSRCLQIEHLIRCQKKKLVLLLNKIDLVPRENVIEWLKYLRNEYPTVAFKSSTQNQRLNLSQSSVPIETASDNLINSSKCLGANILLTLLKNYTRNCDIKQTISVGIIGLPNTGKSSLINSLKRSSVCLSGAVPGLTRHVQEIKLDKHIKLIDSPGIVIAKDDDAAIMSLKNCVRVETIKDPIAPVELLLKKCSKEELIMTYTITDFSNVNDFLQLIARRYGKMKKGGLYDVEAAAREVIKDWNGGKLPYYSKPPKGEAPQDTAFVTELSKPFDIDSILKEEEEMINEIDDTNVKVRAFEIDGTAPVSFELPLEDSNEDQTGANEAEMEEDGVADDDESEEENEEPKQRKGQKNQPKGILKKAGEQAKVTKVKNKIKFSDVQRMKNLNKKRKF